LLFSPASAKRGSAVSSILSKQMANGYNLILLALHRALAVI
jgi:hypothetical protein